MASLKWQASAPAKTSAAVVSSTGSPWFGVSMGLLGLIVGFGIANSQGGRAPQAPSLPSIAQAPGQLPSPQVPPQLPPPPPAGDLPPIDVKKDHVRGNPKAEVAVVQYSDFECPFSKRVQASYKQIADTYGDKVMVVYRHFPLGFHPNAEPAAIATECVAELGGNDAFWKFLDKVYETQGEWNYPQYAKDIGLDEAKFKECVASGKHKQLVQNSMNGGSQAGVNGTPGNIVINLKTKKSQLVSGAQPFENFKTAIDAALKGA